MEIMKHKILVANRGEIAVRIIEACHLLNIPFASIYMDEDASSEHIKITRNLGGELYKVSAYHDSDAVFEVMENSGATAVHPGYGYFSEDAQFARRVTEQGKIFIGPSWEVIQALGDKSNTKRIAKRIGVPTVPGTDVAIRDTDEAESIARALYDDLKEQGIEHPAILLKAASGGGGMGIEEVRDMSKFKTIFNRLKGFAMRLFKDDGIIIEQLITDYSHVEVQILADRKGLQPVHFGTRNCSIQSTRRQKRLEVAPAFDPSTIEYDFDASRVMDDITNYSLALAKEVKYDNVGTWEWLVTRTGRPYLMEVNTRIQVENGISARISTIHGKEVNLIAEQIRVGLGEDLGYGQDAISFDGFSIEYRIICENPAKNFMPWTGTIEKFAWKNEDWLNVHTHVPSDCNYELPTCFTPNLALAIIWGRNLAEVKERGLSFLNNLVLIGRNPVLEIQTNIEYLKEKTHHILEM